MNYQYVVRSEDNRVIKGKLSATTEQAASELLAYSGYRVLSLKEVVPFFTAGKLTLGVSTIKAHEIVMFSRQLALLLESGTETVTSLELLQAQITNRTFKKILAAVVNDVRGGNPLSQALSKHPHAFPPVYHRLVAVGERTGNLEVVLRRAADYMERISVTQKSIKSALTYPIMLFVVAIVVVAILVTFVLPTFAGLYTSFSAQLPAPTRILLSSTDWLRHYGLWILAIIAVAVFALFAYTRTPEGSYRWSRLTLRFPRIGYINLLNELSRCCRSMALLYGSGLPLPEIMTLVIQGTNNKAMKGALTEVQQSMIAGAGLAGPMAKNKLFLPLMVQMTAVGEQTGNMDKTLSTVADNYETEADDKTKAMVAIITPAMTAFIGLLVGFVALAMFSAMYSIYGQAKF